MTDTTCHMSISLDGFVAGPDQSREHPLGKRGRELHGWHLGDEPPKWTVQSLACITAQNALMTLGRITRRLPTETATTSQDAALRRVGAALLLAVPCPWTVPE